MKEKKLRLFFYPPKNTKNKYIFNILTGLKKNKVLNVNKHMSHSFFNLIAKILFYRFLMLTAHKDFNDNKKYNPSSRRDDRSVKKAHNKNPSCRDGRKN